MYIFCFYMLVSIKMSAGCKCNTLVHCNSNYIYILDITSMFKYHVAS